MTQRHGGCWRTFIALAIAALIADRAATAQGTRLGAFEGHGDIGSPKIAGAATYNAVSQEYALAAGGVNMWAQRDEFHFVWKRMTGDFILQARVELLGKGVDPHRKAGWMIRPSQDADAPYVDGVIHGDGLTSLQFRRTKGAITEQKEMTIKGPDVIQLERKGGAYIFSAAKYGEPFTVVEVADINLGDEVMIGLALCSHNPEVMERAIFRDVRITKPAKDTFVPYRDFIGSVLEILDVETGHRQIIHSSAQPIEAPNWTPDGSALIYNRSGRAEGWGGLYRFDLATRQATLIDTGVANRNNNDHVLSFDGSMLGLSDQGPASGNRSTVYTVPVGGGTPKRITTLSPSYLHSWSPDGKDLIFTGGRNSEFDIYRIPADGSGPEVNLTNTKGLDDGPEYTPDGKYIYFNSARTGSMQIWRMKPDGKDQEQVTNDEYYNWFPHVSPDGKWIAIISFQKDIPVNDHPYYKRVYLRLMAAPGAMPASGGAPKVIAYVYGGQGTINVPSWSPDSKLIAFVSNTDMTGPAQATGPQRFEPNVRAYETADRAAAPPAGAILLAGDSQFYRWKTAAEDLPGYTIVNRGIDSLQMSDLLHFADRLVLPYKARLIVLHAGGNDVHNGRTPEQLLADFKAFVVKVRASQPGVPIAFSSITPGPGRWDEAGQRRRANQVIKDYVATDKSLHFIDLWDAMLTADGKPREDLWVEDRIHPNHAGYKLRVGIMTPILGKPDKSR